MSRVDTPSSLRPFAAPAGFYFFIFAALGALVPFLPVLLEERGITRAQVGLIMAAFTFCDTFVVGLWGVMADALRARTHLLRICGLCAGAMVLVLWSAQGFWQLFAAAAVLCTFRAPLVALSDASTRALLGPQGHLYGRIRIFGSIGFAVAAFGVGEWGGGGAEAAVLGTAAIAYFGAGFTAFALPSPSLGRHTGVIRKAARHLRRPAFAAFLLSTVIYYFGHACYDAFIGLHFKDLGQSQRFVGLAWSVGVVAEVILMWFTPAIFSRFQSKHLLVFCAGIAAIRWGFLAWATDPTLIMLSQPLHAVTFGLWYVALVDITQRDAPEELRATLQTLAIASLGAGRLLGFAIGGRLMESHGGATLFALAAGTSVLAAGAYTLRNRLKA